MSCRSSGVATIIAACLRKDSIRHLHLHFSLAGEQEGGTAGGRGSEARLPSCSPPSDSLNGPLGEAGPPPSAPPRGPSGPEPQRARTRAERPGEGLRAAAVSRAHPGPPHARRPRRPAPFPPHPVHSPSRARYPATGRPAGCSEPGQVARAPPGELLHTSCRPASGGGGGGGHSREE